MRRCEIELAEVFQSFQNNELSPILIKGWAAARNYPADSYRELGDIDIAFSSAEFTRASLLKTSSDFNIDLHCELRHYDTTPWHVLFARSESIQLNEVDIRVLRPEDHLRVMAIHWLNDGGVNRERLWDIYYAVINRPKDFDWDLCLNSVSKRRRKWITTTIALTNLHLGLDIAELPLSESDLDIPAWLSKTIAREWSTDVRMRPLETCLHDRKLFFQQLRKRFPPNPIQATIEGEGQFNDSWRLPIQIRTAFARVLPSIKRIGMTMKRRIAKGN